MRPGSICISPSRKLITGYGLWNVPKGILLNYHGQQRKCYTPFPSEILGLLQIVVPKGKGVSGSFYKNVVLKKIANKDEKNMSKNWSLACPLVIWQCSSPQILNCTTVFEVWKDQCIVTLSLQPRPGPMQFCLLSEIKKEKHLTGRRYRSRIVLGCAVHQFLTGVPNDEYEYCLKNWINRLKWCVLTKAEYFEGTWPKNDQLLINVSEKKCPLQKFSKTLLLCQVSKWFAEVYTSIKSTKINLFWLSKCYKWWWKCCIKRHSHILNLIFSSYLGNNI